MNALFNLVLFFTISCLARADEEKTTPADLATNKLAVIQQEYKEAEASYHKAKDALPEMSDRKNKVKELAVQFNHKEAGLYMAAVELARSNPKSETGLAALKWVLEPNNAYYLPAGALGLEIMKQQYSDNPKIGSLIADLSFYLTVDNVSFLHLGVDFLNLVIEKNPDRTVRGQAVLGLGWVAKQKFMEIEWQDIPDTNHLALQAEAAFERVIRDYGDCTNLLQGTSIPTLAGEAEPELYELRHLRIGLPAPEIIGEDLAGAPMKLSDYRGKVVLLVFWASWCGPCMGEVPHEKELAEYFKGRPFALMGVSGDYQKDKAAKAVIKNQISWRTFWDGKEGPGGPIAKAWNVHFWPTVYVLDQQGIIRQKNLRGKRLDGPLEKLVKAVEDEKR